jgi:predicted amidohydrolase YtcJ
MINRKSPVIEAGCHLAGFMILVSVLAGGCGPREVDLVVTGANVYTVSEALPRATAFAVDNGRFVAVGVSEEIDARFDGRERLDAGGRTIVPGFIDAHAHLMGRGIARLEVDLVGTKSLEEVIERLLEHEARLPVGPWLTGRGWDQNDWAEREFPDRNDLDSLFPDRPVWLARIDGHAYWANSATLRVAGEDRIRSARDPEGGRIVRDSRGEPTGIFVDRAASLVEEYRPAISKAMLRSALAAVLEETARVGLTGVHDPGADPDTIQVYRDAIEEGSFTIRAYVAVEGHGEAFRMFCERPLEDGGDLLMVNSVKFYADGALGSRGAALLQDYSDDPGNRGLLFGSRDEFKKKVAAAMQCGFQVMTHAIGDRANQVVLDAYEDILTHAPDADLRLRIEHAQVLTSEDVGRFGQLGIIASVQPTHATSDMYWAADRVGHERILWSYPWRSLLDSGARLALGSDAPVESLNPILGFHAAVTRQDANGWPSDGWFSEQRLTREEALKGYTLDAAYAGFMEDRTGSIASGKLADFVVLDRDIMMIPASDILGTHVIATYLGGRAIYADAGWTVR